jgi:hypothetical protein
MKSERTGVRDVEAPVSKTTGRSVGLVKKEKESDADKESEG